MLATVTTKTIRDRWLGSLIGATVLALFLWLGMAIYQQIDLSFYTNLGEVFLSLMHIPEDADVGSLAYGAIYASYGGLTLASLALALGSAAIAGEERNGTIGLLLGNPTSRTSVLVGKATAMVALAGFGALILWAAAVIVPSATGVSITGMHPGALVFHIFVNAVFYGFMALAIGAWTGRTALASGVTVAVMLLSWIAASLFPALTGLEDLAKAFPWYYYDAGLPVFNGVDWGRLAVLLGGIVVFAAVAVIGVNRRDLRGQSVGTTLVDRLRDNPSTKKLADRLAGSARVSRIWIKTVSEHQGLVIVVGYVMFLLMGVAMGPLYGLMDEAVVQYADQLPETMLAMFGGGDMSTAEGFFQVETFSMMAPIAVIVVTVVMAARGLAGEEARRTMGLLLANPVPRSRVVLEKSLAMVVNAALVGFATFAGVAIGSLLGGLGMSIANIAAVSLLVTLLGLVFGGLALALSAGTGRTGISVYVTSGVALALYLVNSFVPLNDDLAGWARWSPFYYYLGGDPLVTGMQWGHAALFAGLFLGLVGLSVVLFQRRDLRQVG
ncbi:MAG TPA: ABC transporter permease subunit [Coriobacteriia bacterium]|nr:ABC transporter permease subunit [Coriobacteriia bacterium]